jgi:hypothetical protein
MPNTKVGNARCPSGKPWFRIAAKTAMPTKRSAAVRASAIGIATNEPAPNAIAVRSAKETQRASATIPIVTEFRNMTYGIVSVSVCLKLGIIIPYRDGLTVLYDACEVALLIELNLNATLATQRLSPSSWEMQKRPRLLAPARFIASQGN